MKKVRNATGAIMVVVAMIMASVVTSPMADAQEPGPEVFTTCSLYGRTVSFGGPLAANAAESLRILGSPNPPGIEDALEVIISAEADGVDETERPDSLTVDQAIQTLDSYFGGICNGLDVCPLIWTASGSTTGDPVIAAGLLRGITAPAPPGIDAALALIAQEVDESPFHTSVAEAQAQLVSYFNCPIEVSPLLPSQAEICGHVAVLGIPEGPFAVDAAFQLKLFGTTDPSVIAALDVLAVAADFDQLQVPLAEIDAALSIVQSHFQSQCDNIDRCALVRDILGPEPFLRAQSANTLRRLETPQPPGNDAALALIAGTIDESPFHTSVAEAVEQIRNYYSFCGGLVITGPAHATPMAVAGGSMVLLGAACLVARRRLA
jgi:hypothetical protein